MQRRDVLPNCPVQAFQKRGLAQSIE
jgi:hypothetical protein